MKASTESVEAEAEDKAVEVSVRAEVDRHNLLIFALVMVVAASVGLSLCTTAIAWSLAKVERALRRAGGGDREGRLGQ